MRVLLDECVPRKLARELSSAHHVSTAVKEHLGGSPDGRLLNAAQGNWDVLVTVDRNLIFQQNLHKIPIAVIVLHAQSNRFAAIKPLVPELLLALSHIQPRQVLHIPATATP